MNSDSIQGKWTELKGEIRNVWGKLTHDDLDRTKGNLAAIAGLIRQHYGDAKEDVSTKLREMFSHTEKAAADKSEEVKQDLREARRDNPNNQENQNV